MEVFEKLRSVGQSLWLGHISRELIRNGSLMQYIEEYSVTGLSFSPQSFHRAISQRDSYDSAIAKKLGDDLYGEPLIYSLIYEDVRYAADLVRAVYDRTDGVDGWAVIPVSPLSISNTENLFESLADIHKQINRPNGLISLPALPDRLDVIEELVYKGIPINITNIYSPQHYLGVARSCQAGIERRIRNGKKSIVSAFISINICRLESYLSQSLDREAAMKLSIAMAGKIYKTMREMFNSNEWNRIYSTGFRPLRLVWNFAGGTGMREANCSLYKALIAPHTIVLLPDKSIKEFISDTAPEQSMVVDGRDCEQVLDDSKRAGFDVEEASNQLQDQYLNWMMREWAILLETIAIKTARISQNRTRENEVT